MNIRIMSAALLAAVTLPSPQAWAGDLVYTPINPSFGGSPLNSSHLMGLANAQRTATARADRDTDGEPGEPGTPPGNTDADLFIRQLQGRLLSALASQVTEAIFGENPQESGTVTFGDTTVTFERTIESIRLIITDPTGTTVIEVPQLVTTTAEAQAQPQSELMHSLATGSLSGAGDLTTDIELGSGGALDGGLGSIN